MPGKKEGEEAYKIESKGVKWGTDEGRERDRKRGKRAAEPEGDGN